ncbi:MAG: Lrp/AsnC family transcriptional regulator [Candidatus Heimdallarchaeaceae archaeon]
MAVIKELLSNGRKSFVDIAYELNVTETAIRRRVKKMEDEGIITKYSVEINPRELGFGVKALIGIDTTPQRYLAVIQNLKKNDKIVKLYSSSGDHMIMMECWFEDDEKLTEFLEHLEEINGVIDICPTIITDLIK